MEEALAITRTAEDKSNESILLYNLAGIYFAAKEYDQAKENYQNSMAIGRSIEDTIGVALGQLRLADIIANEKQWDDALPLYIQSARLFEH